MTQDGICHFFYFSSVQSLSCVRLFATPWITACQASLSITNSWSSFKLMSIESVMLSNRLSLCCPPFLLPSIFPSIRVFSMNQLFQSDGQRIGASALASVFPKNIQGWFPLELTGLMSLQSRGLSRVFSSTTFQSISSLVCNCFYGSILMTVHDYWKNHIFDYTYIFWKSDVSAF